MRPDGMPGSCVCLQTSTICSRRSARHQIRGNNIKWHSHVDYIIKKYYPRGLAACNYQGQDWNHQKIMWSKHSSKAWWSNQHNVLCAQFFRSYSKVSLYNICHLQQTCSVFQLRALSRLCLTNYIHPSCVAFSFPPKSFPLIFFHLWLLSFLSATTCPLWAAVHMESNRTLLTLGISL